MKTGLQEGSAQRFFFVNKMFFFFLMLAKEILGKVNKIFVPWKIWKNQGTSPILVRVFQSSVETIF